MTRKGPVRNMAASVHARLMTKARERKRPFNEVFQYYAMERLLYRLSKSKHARRFVLKGALMFAAWNVPVSRPTKDIDLLGRLKNSIEGIVGAMRDICRQPVEPDGFVFDPDGIEAANIAEDAEYGGIRVFIKGRFLDNAKVLVQLDIGFGDVVVPAEMPITYPTILDFPAPVLQGYSRESAISEKFDAMVKRGMLNSRMKDFFDIWFLSRQFEFDGAVLADAIRRTFETRSRPIMADAVCFSPEFSVAKDAQWKVFLRRGGMKDVPQEMREVVAAVAAFLKPVATALADGEDFRGNWKPNGPWTKTSAAP